MTLANATTLALAIGLATTACTSSSGDGADAGAPPSDASGSDAASADASNPSPDASTRDASGDAPSDSGATLGTCDAGVSCNAVPNAASIVVTTEDPATLPAFSGGALVDGTYLLTSATSYGGAGAGGQRQRITFVFANGTLQLVQDAPGCVDAPSGTATYTTTGATLALTLTCPVAGTQPAQYTATPTSFVYSTDTGTRGLVFMFTKQ